MNKNFFIKTTSVLALVLLFGVASHIQAEELPDITAPIITLLGDATISIEQGTLYTDAGATAQDDVDGDITANIVMNGTVDTANVGVYTETYNVSDVAGNPATPVVRTVTVTPVVVIVPTETIIVRSGDTVIWQGDVPLPDDGTESINDVNGNPHTISTRSVLALVKDAEVVSGAFTLSNLTYYDSFGAFYFKCITPTGGTELCDNWQYAVGSTTPWTSIDQTILGGGETIGIYFGNNHQVSFNSTTISAGGTFVATAEKYNYLDNTWSALPGVSIGVTTPNESDPWSPTVISTNPVDTNGSATITIENPGTYNVGIVEDYYFPSYAITVNTISQSGGGGGGTPTTFSVPNAISYLKSVQANDGSFGGSDLYTDWAGIAYGAAGIVDSSRSTLLSYLASHNTLYSLVTDNERRAMALLALGQNPYAFNGVNYIDAITKTFDGTQIGDANLDNDDIFGLIVLSKAGYTIQDPEISKTISFVLGAQLPNGSWDSSVDMTAAGIQALAPFISVAGVSDAIAKAGTYLQNAQASDGGWGNASASSWATQAMNALGVVWTKNGKTTANYFGSIQVGDGAALPSNETLANRIWATSYAIPAVLGKSWDAILIGVSKPATSTGGNSTGDENVIPDTTKVDTTDTLKTTTEIKSEKVEVTETEIPIEKSTPVLVESKPFAETSLADDRENIRTDSSEAEDSVHSTNDLTASAGGSGANVPIYVTLGVFILVLAGGGWYWFRRS